MKAIEQRAIEYAKGRWDELTAKEAYIAGATEQQAIDEEVRLKKSDDMTKAEYDRETAFADWYFKNGKSTPTYSDAIEWARKQTIDEACNWLSDYLVCEYEILTKADCENVINELRKVIGE